MLWKRGIKVASDRGTSPDRRSCSESIEGKGESDVSGISDTCSWLDILV